MDLRGGDRVTPLCSRAALAFTSASIGVLALLPAAARALPDQRAYEQVTPIQKNGANAYGATDLVHASPSGERLAYLSSAPFPGAQGAESLPTYLSSRDAGGWSTVGLLPPQSTPTPNQSAVIGWSEDLSEVLVSTNSVEDSAAYGLLLRDSSTGALQPITSGGAGGDSYAFDGATPDDGSFVFEDRAKEPLAGGAEDADNVYQWSGDQLSLIGRLPDGSTPPEGSFAGPYAWQTPDTSVGGALDHLYTEHVISSDGSRVFFTAAGAGQLYVREGNLVSVRVSASQKTNGSGPGGIDLAGPQPAAFMAATPDGEEVFFTSAEELTNDANTGSADQGNDLYSYDVGTGHLSDLTVDPNPADPNGASVKGVLGVSEDGSYVYFVANGDLTGEEENADGGKAESGRSNLYLWHSGATTFIATLSATQHPGEVDSMDWAPSATAGIEKNSRVTPDGQTLLFASELPLTGYDSNGDTEFYRYSAPSAQLTCVSCDPSGEAALGDAYLQGPPPSGSPPTAHQTSLTQNLSDDGVRVFFVSPDPLVPQDTNGQLDVYEWEANGSGSCQIAAGCLYLISTGQGSEPSYLADASADGNDVFFFTSQQLVGQDQDDEVDVYDARVGGGIAAQNPAPETPCVGETCKSPPTPQLSEPTPGSSTFSGPGNPAASPTPNAPPHRHKRKRRGHARHGVAHGRDRRSARRTRR